LWPAPFLVSRRKRVSFRFDRLVPLENAFPKQPDATVKAANAQILASVSGTPNQEGQLSNGMRRKASARTFLDWVNHIPMPSPYVHRHEGRNAWWTPAKARRRFFRNWHSKQADWYGSYVLRPGAG